MEDTTRDEELVRSLLREQHPDLAQLELRLVKGGWDNRMWRLGDTLAVRLPRTPRAADLLRKERRWLPGLAPALPLPVPDHLRAGRPTRRFPRPWAVTRWVQGDPADLAPLRHGGHSAGRLAAFLTALHRPAPVDAPSDPRRGGRLSALAEAFAENLRHAPAGTSARAREVWEEAVAAPPWQEDPVWLHGDLHPAKAVVAGGTLAGVADFGELGAGDPAADLSAAWLLLPPGASGPFFGAYAKVLTPRSGAATATIRRARGWAVLHALGLIAIGDAGDRGLPGGKPTWGPAGRAALRSALAGPSTQHEGLPAGNSN